MDLSALDALTAREVIGPLRYRNLNEEVEAFRTAVPYTAKNLTFEVDRRLRAVWAGAFPRNYRGWKKSASGRRNVTSVKLAAYEQKTSSGEGHAREADCTAD